ncbi:MAG: hypothetical protein ACKOEZ_04430 [Spartobacteria bacterium]
MNAITLPAKCVNNQIILAEPFSIPENRVLFVTILSSEQTPKDGRSFVQDWTEISATGLESAYSDDEPEYTPAMLKEANPDYAAG